MSSTIPLAGKTAFVTGGSRGIGAAIVRQLARDGANVAFTYQKSAAKAHQVAAEVQQTGRRALAIAANMADVAAVAAAVERTTREFGRLDCLVNNAGIFIAKPFDSVTLDEYEQMMAVNVRSVFVASQTAARQLSDGGRVVTIGSNLAERAGRAGLTLYAMSKSALVGLTKGLARDLGPRGITVNLVQPGPIDTDMNPADGPYAEMMRSSMAIPRHGSPEQIAALVSYLVSERGQFMTGALITMDGGTNA